MTAFRMSDLRREAAIVGGEWIAASSQDVIEVVNPFDNTKIGETPKLAAEAIEEAISAAAQAQQAWQGTTAKHRSDILFTWYTAIIEHVDELANILTEEQGKVLAEARGEILYAADYVKWYAEEARRVFGTIAPSPSPDEQLLYFKRPIGVVAAITPWNFPAAMVTRKVAPALASGCSIVLKPASQTPFTALALASLAQSAGLPDGLFNVVTGSASRIGDVFCSDSRVKKLSFTGSTEVGSLLYAKCAPTVKKLGLELGGNAPLIVFDDADIPHAVAETIKAKFRNSGQTCVCANRILVQDKVYDEFAAHLVKSLEKMAVGSGFDPDVSLGPLIDEAAVSKVEEHVDDARNLGASVAIGGQRHPSGPCSYEPTVLTGVTDKMKVFHEETFGPIAPLLRFSTEDEAIDMANRTDFGLASYAFTQDLGRAFRLSRKLEFGIIGMNTGIISAAEAPFGGINQSGLGREGGHEGIEDYLETIYVRMSGLHQS